MEYQNIELIEDEGVAVLYLNRPEVLNALNEAMKGELIDALKRTARDDKIRVMVLSGRGEGFCAGVDLNRFIEAQGRVKVRKTKSGFKSLDLQKAFIHYPKPIIAAINGAAYGFGFTVSLICDIRLASERAKFSCAFARVGVTPEFCSTYFMPRLMGYGKAAELVFTARPFEAHEALEIGAVNKVFPHKQLMAEAEKMARQIASLPPLAIKKSKELLRRGMESSLEQVLNREAAVFLNSMKTEEHKLALRKLLDQMKFAKGKN
jgi:2-(1,2-epoxy-1,2-dihydrophenyl)acetyl-CoA isomerase